MQSTGWHDLASAVAAPCLDAAYERLCGGTRASIWPDWFGLTATCSNLMPVKKHRLMLCCLWRTCAIWPGTRICTFVPVPLPQLALCLPSIDSLHQPLTRCVYLIKHLQACNAAPPSIGLPLNCPTMLYMSACSCSCLVCSCTIVPTVCCSPCWHQSRSARHLRAGDTCSATHLAKTNWHGGLRTRCTLPAQASCPSAVIADATWPWGAHLQRCFPGPQLGSLSQGRLQTFLLMRCLSLPCTQLGGRRCLLRYSCSTLVPRRCQCRLRCMCGALCSGGVSNGRGACLCTMWG